MPSRYQFASEAEFQTALRDYFAAKALVALIPIDFEESEIYEDANVAHQYADAMLKARAA
jgi:hypothetical protein